MNVQMAYRCDAYYIFVVIVHLTFISFSASHLSCHQLLTKLVSGRESHGVLFASEHIFEKGYYESHNGSHYRVCICQKTACLRKCCLPDQAFVNSTCTPQGLDIKPNVYSDDLNLIADFGVSNFYRIYGDTCTHKSFHLEPEVYPSDEHYLMLNGTLVLPNESGAYDPSQFCFENVLKIENGVVSQSVLRAFVCFHEETEESDKMIVYPIGMIISMPFLLATFVVYSLPELRNLHGKNLMCQVASLLAAYIVLVTIQLANHALSDPLCIAFAYVIQYTFLATFFWLNVMCFDIWSTFSGFGKFSGHAKEKESKKFILYSCYAWGCPTVIFIVTLAIEYAPNLPDFIIRPNIGTKKCYFATKMATLAYFYAPIAVVLVCDIVLFVLTAIKICKVRRETKVLTQNESRRNDEASKQRYNLYLKLFLVMGINWVMEIISWIFEGPKGLWYLTDFMNSLQGLFIFWIFVCNRKIKKVLQTKFCPRMASRETETHTSSYKMSTSATSSCPMVSGQSIQMNNMGNRGRNQR